MPRALQKDYGPATWAIFNGLIWDMPSQRVGVSPTRLKEIVSNLSSLLALAGGPPGRQWRLESLRTTVGRLTSLLAVVPQGKPFLQACYAAVAAAVAALRRQAGRSASHREPKGSGQAAMTPSFAALWELRW